MKNGVNGKCFKDVKNKEFSRGRYICIILWSHVCPSTCFKPTQFQGAISPRFGTDLYVTEIYKRTALLSQSSYLFFKRGLHVCVATSVLIRTKFKPDLFYSLCTIHRRQIYPSGQQF